MTERRLRNVIFDAANDCPECDGTGKVDGATCPMCDGTGDIDEDELEDSASIQLTDSFVIDGKLRRTADGYLTGFAKVARTGIQVYKGTELGRPTMDEVRIYRPPEQVFATDAMRSMAHKPTTLLHPKVMVDSTNWRQYATGYTGDEIVRDGNSVKVPLILTDQAAIDAYEKDGIKELSMGYTTELVWKAGKTPDGEAYDAIQTAIRANHLAIVPVARAGSDFRLGDGRERNNGAKPMKTIMVDGLPVEVADDNSGAIITRHIAKLEAGTAEVQKQFDAFKKKSDDEDEDDDKKAKDAQAKLDAKDGEIVALKKQLEDAQKLSTPEVLDAKLLERTGVVDAAKTLLPKTYAFDGKKVEDIRRDAVKVKLGDAVAKMSDDAIGGAFMSLTADAAKNNGARNMADAIGNGARLTQDSVQVHDAKSKALDERDANYRNAYKVGQPGYKQPGQAA